MAFRHLEKIVISDKWMDKFRQKHKSRAFEVRLKGGLIKPRHPHRNNPFCNICDEDYNEWDIGYRLYVGGYPVVYHADCIIKNWDSKKVKNIAAQDRSYRRKLESNGKPFKELDLRKQIYRYFISKSLDETISDREILARTLEECMLYLDRVRGL